jgi:hypothetical protein
MEQSVILRAANHVRRGALDPAQREALAAVLLTLAKAIADGVRIPTFVALVHERAVSELAERPGGER